MHMYMNFHKPAYIASILEKLRFKLSVPGWEGAGGGGRAEDDIIM